MRTGRRGLIRDLNRTLVLNLVRETGGLSRATISRVSGLSPSTVTSITASLIDEGYLVEDTDQGPPSGVASATVGRPATILRVNPRAGFVVGIKIASDHVTATVTDLAATPLGTASAVHGQEATENEIVALVRGAMDGAISDAGVDRGRVVGVGIGVPGAVDQASGRVAASPLLGWGDLDLVSLLDERLDLPVQVDNDVNTLTVAEQLFGSGRGFANMVVVTVGRGIGMGIVINGVVHRGAHGGAGELGHIQVTPGGQDCWCGRRGCLETVAAEPAIVREVLAATGRLVQPAEIAALADRQPQVASILERAGAHVGGALAMVATVLDPQRIVISGEGVRLGPHYLDAIGAAFAAQQTQQQEEDLIDVVIEPWGDEAWARGAASLVLRELFQPAHLRDESTSTPSPFEWVTTTMTRNTARGGRGERR
jgi:predicted NBD/HSP70 family sugar kinase